MSILIEGMEMPKTESEVLIIAIKSDGSVYPVRIDGDGQPIIFPNEEMKNSAVPVPPHGRLGDLDDFIKRMTELMQKAEEDDFALGVAWYETFIRHIELAPTIIEAEADMREPLKADT